MTTSYTYEPFGNATSSGASSTNSFQYTGRETDGTRLAFFRARYYSPTLQRFLSEDPVGLAGGDVNLYAYVADQPLGLIDPLGLCGGGFGAFLNLITGRCGFWDFVQPIVQPIQRFYDEHRRLISCTLFATSVLTWPTALAGRSYEFYEGIRAGQNLREITFGGSRIVRGYENVAVASTIGTYLTGGCL